MQTLLMITISVLVIVSLADTRPTEKTLEENQIETATQGHREKRNPQSYSYSYQESHSSSYSHSSSSSYKYSYSGSGPVKVIIVGNGNGNKNYIHTD
ncbi:unnamed protein product [Pieris brassicae]|uniref:Uncharacterized protein n=1 Tax=Pieris brassicae TaxID=7116 RepID=A0A9P0TP33_PIEBR|nr:unnamed protein product [Pieris brassicae]